jgi:gamma-glutamyl phosphate reductase
MKPTVTKLGTGICIQQGTAVVLLNSTDAIELAAEIVALLEPKPTPEDDYT